METVINVILCNDFNMYSTFQQLLNFVSVTCVAFATGMCTLKKRVSRITDYNSVGLLSGFCAEQCTSHAVEVCPWGQRVMVSTLATRRIHDTLDPQR
jgi:hypothetical protein